MFNKYGLWGRLAILLLISFFFAACDGDDGAAGPAGPAGAAGADGAPGDTGPAGPPAGDDPVAAAKVESCSTCHGGVGDEHQAEYNKYAGTDFALTITDVSSTALGTVPETWDATMTIHLEKNGTPVNGVHEYVSRGTTRCCIPTGVDQASFYTVQYTSGTQTFDNSKSFSMDLTSDLGLGNFVARTTGATFDPVPVNGQAYAYVAGGLLDTEGMALYENVTNTTVAYGDVGTYASAANVEGCEACHGTPYLKHGYRAAMVTGLPDFASCKSCHYDTRTGHHEDWQWMVDEPFNWATDAATATDYSYTANIMNDTHMSHAMEFPYPQSMANCATCHEGKLAQVLDDSNFTPETCLSCHPVQGIDAWGQIGERGDPDYVAAEDYNQSHRAPALEFLWTQLGVEGFHDVVTSSNCLACHGAAGAASSLTAYHTGYDATIYDAAGQKYSDLNTVSIGSVTLAGNLLTINFSANNVAIVPEVLVSLYGWDSKNFIIPSHARDANAAACPGSHGDGCQMEYVPESSGGGTNPLFTEDAASVPGDWMVTLDMAAFQPVLTDDIPTLIANGDVTMAEINIAPELVVGTTEVVLKGAEMTFDLGGSVVAVDYFKGANATVDIVKCNDCHDALTSTFHAGSGRNGDSIVVCKNCHNPTYPGSHLEMASRSIDSYAHAIHSFQPFDLGSVDTADPVEVARAAMHEEHTFPNFTITNCEGCHVAGTYNVPDQAKSMPGVLSASDNIPDRNIGSLPEAVTGPASRACGGCHRVEFINEDLAGDLAAFNAHTEAFGTYADNAPVEGVDDVTLYGIIEKIMSMFE